MPPSVLLHGSGQAIIKLYLTGYYFNSSIFKMNILSSSVRKKFAPVTAFVLTFLVVSFATRLFLFVYAFPQLDINFKNIAGIFFIGLFYDLCAAVYFMIPLILLLWLSNEKVFKKPWYWIVIGLFILLSVQIAFFNLVPKEYNKELPKAVLGLVGLEFAFYILLLLRPARFRLTWRTIVLDIVFCMMVFLLLMNAVGEFIFWEEFGSRYNFIAVDYLVYTHEVSGNIWESYPVGWIIFFAIILTAGIFLFFRKSLKNAVYTPVSFGKRSLAALVLLFLPVMTYWFVDNSFKNFDLNSYVTELAGNGLYELGAAYRNNDLNFYRFYQSLPDSTAMAEVKRQIIERSPGDKFVNPDSLSVERDITYAGPEKRMNVVLITMESFSASFMKFFGNAQNITPYLDSLIHKGMFFSNFYATGTRTVRGLETLSLSIPPIPGQSILRRPGNENLFTIGSVFKSKGYAVKFIYGGYSSFDNMGYFFRHNGYDVIDRTALKPSEIHYANIWGVADEDLFSLALNEMDKEYEKHQLFFNQIMTVSNHRPYTYPENRIDISPRKQQREGAVKYTDYAVNRFLREASLKPWFKNTLFVILADHCAYAAGKSALPVTGYHIPLWIYSPGFIQPEEITKLTSQIDLAPTILGILNMSYRSKFFGQDIFKAPDGTERAFISTYQGLGYIRNGELIIQQPPKKIVQYRPDFITGESKKEMITDSLYRQAISYYQLAEHIYKSNGYRKDTANMH